MSDRWKLASLFLLSAATLLFETDLSRLLSVAQFYHFAFMVVSLALLGFGASGTALALFPRFIHKSLSSNLIWLSTGCALSMLGAYLLANVIPVDTFSIAWDSRQVILLGLDYLSLTLPFFFSGMVVGILIARSPQNVGKTYAANLTGSALGCLVALAAPAVTGGEGVVTLSCSLAFLAAIILIFGGKNQPFNWGVILAAAGLAFGLVDLGLRLSGLGGYPFLRLQLSAYKGLSYALQQPGARLESSQWNAFSRVDEVSSQGIHSFPGLSYTYLEPLPAQKGVFIDGDDLNPLLSPVASTQFSAFLPGAIAYQLRPQSQVLVLGANAGLEVLTALAQGSGQVVAVEANPLVLAAAAQIYSVPGLQVYAESERVFLRNSTVRYDVIALPLTTSFHPVQSGAYSLAEDYRFTSESFVDILNHLKPQGIFVFTRWLQYPPSEDLRAFGLAVTALEKMGLSAQERIVAFHGYNTATFLVKTQPFSSQELSVIRQFTGERAYDLSYAPGIRADETNRYNILSEPIYYQAYQSLLPADTRQAFFQQYPFDVSPPSDDHPFFGHYFKWSQASQILARLGSTWQPFGGAGYFVILALLVLSIFLAGVLILLPIGLVRRKKNDLQEHSKRSQSVAVYLAYFGLIGFAYLFVEIPLIQKFILFLGYPAYALTTILFTLLFFSGLGSYLGKRIPFRLSIGLLVVILAAMPAWVPALFDLTLGATLPQRMLLTITVLAPTGFLMGIPFQAGIRKFETAGLAAHIPWAWAVNGSTSVVSAVLAALLALTFGFNWVLVSGAICYASALILIELGARSQGVKGTSRLSLRR